MTNENREQQLEQALRDVLEMLDEWDNTGVGLAGFGGFKAINQAERLLELPLTEVQ